MAHKKTMKSDILRGMLHDLLLAVLYQATGPEVPVATTDEEGLKASIIVRETLLEVPEAGL